MRFTELERKDRQIPLILQLDAAGTPRKWMHWHDAVIAHCTDKILWSLGEPIVLTGGKSAATGETSILELPPIIATSDMTMQKRFKAPALTNRELFRRDQNLCLYCGNEYPPNKLTRDHVIPVSQGGPDTWTNCVAACRSCNHAKRDRTPEQARMPLRAIPYTPNPAEFLILQNRRIIADQMAYLKKMLPESSRAWKYVVN